MTRFMRRIGLLAVVLLPLALLLFIALAAAGQETDLSATVNTSSVLVPASDFVDDGFTTRDYAYDETGGYTYPITDTSGTCLQAPLYLPDGATVSSFGGYVLDNDPAGRLQDIELRRVAYQPGPHSLSDVLGESSTTNGYASDEIIFASDESISNAVVDAGNYIYYAAVCMNGGPGEPLRLYAVEAFYTQ